MRLSLQTKINFLILFIAISFIAVLIVLRFGELNKIEYFFEDEIRERQILLENILLEKEKNLENFVYDNSYWDDMYYFVDKQDKKWARVNIDLVLPSFETQFAWVLNKNFGLVYHYNSAGDTSSDLFFCSDEFFIFVTQKKFSHFFVNLSNKILEIRTAPIQPSNDTNRVSIPNGYLIAGREWNQNFISSVAKIFDSKIFLINYLTKDTLTNNKVVQGEWHIDNSVSFKNIYGKDIATLYSKSEFFLIEKTMEYFNNQIIFIIILSPLILLFISIYLFHFVTKPLKKIHASLESGNPASIKSLYTQRTEFGKIAYLIQLFFIQKEKLLNEIEERKRVEQALSESEILYKTLFETSFDAFYIIDSEFKLFYSNKRFKEIFFHNEIDSNSISYRNFLPIDDFGNYNISINSLFHQKIGPYPVKIKIQSLLLDFEFLSNPITLKSISLVLIRLTDISEIKKLEKESHDRLIHLEQSERLASLGMIVAGVAHEINNPSSFVSTNIKYLQQQFELITPILNEYFKRYPERKLGNLELELYKNDLADLFYDLNEGAARITKLVSELKTFSTGKEELHFEEFDLNEVINIALRFIKTEITQKKIGIIKRLCHPGLIYSDRQKISQIIFNIIINAIQAINKEKGEIKITSEDKNDKMILEINDNGVGISKEKIRNIFDPFFTTKNYSGGSGIGLSLAKSLAEKLGISISVDSEQNNFTKFTLTIPKNNN